MWYKIMKSFSIHKVDLTRLLASSLMKLDPAAADQARPLIHFSRVNTIRDPPSTTNWSSGEVLSSVSEAERHIMVSTLFLHPFMGTSYIQVLLCNTVLPQMGRIIQVLLEPRCLATSGASYISGAIQATLLYRLKS